MPFSDANHGEGITRTVFMDRNRNAPKAGDTVSQTEILIIGVGEEYRKDDGVGPFIARNLRLKNPPGVRIEIRRADGLSVMESWRDVPAVIILDAMKSGARPGTIRRLDPQGSYGLQWPFSRSTHAFGLAEALEMAKALKRFPSYLVIYGIEGKNFEKGTGLSPEVEKAALEVTKLVIKDICEHSEKLHGT